MTTEDKFHAAVNVIRSLPKNGSYQPSHELMLRFYAYYKQATEGPCEKSGTAKPMFWDVVGRAKYTAWQKLGNMSRQTAMDLYVAELLRIVETMSLTDNVATFLSADDAAALGSMPIDDLELISPGVKERVRSQPGSPYTSRPSSRPESPEGLYNGVTNQDSDDEYIDSVEHTPELQAPKKTIPNGVIPSAYQNHNGVTNVYPHTTDISNEITKTLAALQADLHTINQRVTAVEHRKPKMITFGHLSPLLIGFLLMWPFVAFRIMRAIERKN